MYAHVIEKKNFGRLSKNEELVFIYIHLLVYSPQVIPHVQMSQILQLTPLMNNSN